MLGSIWRAVWEDLNTPDQYYADPVGGAGNQGTHVLMAGCIVVAICVIWAVFYREMPYRWPLWFAVVGFYAFVIEYLRQGWRRWDTINDTYFFGLGAAGPLVSLYEVTYRPEIKLGFNEFECGVWLVVLVVSMAAYIWPRAMRAYGGEK
jgi:hypothetical protein